ncbi:MAG: hypothetical protein GVX96_03030 [Bacteroidetes bacterium]|jgi:hypothetical protein|nr:hypothetical protein [Bacteroidota bacterium]
MKWIWIYIVFLLPVVHSFGQRSDLEIAFEQNRIQHQKRAMLTLGTWSVINIGSGLILQGKHNGSEKYFHQMNAGWNVVNLGIAAVGYWKASRSNRESTFQESWDKYESYRKSLLFNAGLDVGYMMGGLYLMERSNRFRGAKSNRNEGWGKSILLQGAFLFTFDIVAYFTSRKMGQRIRPYMKLELPSQGAQLGMTISF